MSFWKELSRRNVVKVGIAYAVAAWLIIHPVDIVFPILHLPDWSITLVAALLIIAFPLILLFSWVYEITPKGLKKTKEVPLAKSITHLTGKRLNYIITGLLVLALAYFVFDKYYYMHGSGTSPAPAVTVPSTAINTTIKSKKSIAVLPFVNISSDKEQEYFVDGLSEEILNSLAQISDLTVIARTSSFTFKNSNKKVQEIANELGVENILEGSVRKSGNTVRITAQLVKAADGSHLWSAIYDRKLKDILVIQEEIARSVANELKTTLGVGESLKRLGGTDNAEAYDLYLAAQVRTNFDLKTITQALVSIESSIKLDPNFALAWVQKADIHNVLTKVGPNTQSVNQRIAALNAVQRAIEIEPDLAEAYAILGSVRLTEGKFIEAATAYGKVTEINPEPLWKTTEYVSLLQDVGYFKKADEILRTALRVVDPLNNGVYQTYMENLAYQGNFQQVEKEWNRAITLFGNEGTDPILITMARIGSGKVESSQAILIPGPIHGSAKKHLDSPKDGLAELRRFYKDVNYQDAGNTSAIMIWAAYFGDPDFAMDQLEKLVNIDAGGINTCWYPVMHDVRQLPRFKKLVKKIGLVDYWNKFGWPDTCHKLDNGDFVCE
jgi:TolB-like protein